jgi:hypothetical protein
MARERNYDAPYQGTGNAVGWTMVVIMAAVAVIFGLWLYPDIAGAPSAPERAVGGQAPKEVRGAFRGSDTFTPKEPQAAINDYNATAQAEYDAAIKAGENPVLVQQAATPLPLPLNSQGEPVISHAQQQQMQQSLFLAEQEGATAVDAQMAAQRATADAEALNRPPDVSYEEAKALLGRDPCSVPRANPHTCSQGLYKPTPVN